MFIHPSPRILGTFFLTVVALTSLLVVYALHAALPFNPIKLPFERQIQMPLFLPEAWAFFTRNPQEENVLAYRAGSTGWELADPGANAEAKTSFGADRRTRALAVEAGLLTSKVRESDWESCSDTPEICIEKAARTLRVENKSHHPTMCGSMALISSRPVPWAWKRTPRAKQIVMPSRVVKLEVSC